MIKGAAVLLAIMALVLTLRATKPARPFDFRSKA
jgi:hypothetical protein